MGDRARSVARVAKVCNALAALDLVVLGNPNAPVAEEGEVGVLVLVTDRPIVPANVALPSLGAAAGAVAVVCRDDIAGHQRDDGSP